MPRKKKSEEKKADLGYDQKELDKLLEAGMDMEDALEELKKKK